jgi:hypothetical protein
MIFYNHNILRCHKLLILVLILVSCQAGKKTDRTFVKEENKCICTGSTGKEYEEKTRVEYSPLILIGTTWYLPFRNYYGELDLLYKENRSIKSAPRDILMSKFFRIEFDTVKTFMDWDIEEGEVIETFFFKDIQASLIEKRAIIDSDTNEKDTIFRFQTFDDTHVQALIKYPKGVQNERFMDEQDAISYAKRNNVTIVEMSVVKELPYNLTGLCYLEVSKNKGYVSYTVCSGDTSHFSRCDYKIDYSNYSKFINNDFPKVRVSKRPFFPKMSFSSTYEDTLIGDNMATISDLSIDTNSIVINNEHYYILSIHKPSDTKVLKIPKTGGTHTGAIQALYGLLRVQKGKFIIVPYLYDSVNGGKEVERVIFDINARVGEKWEVKHLIFGGLITLKDKKGKWYSFDIKPNKNSQYPNLINFEVDKDLGFIAFSYKSGNDKIIRQKLIN